QTEDGIRDFHVTGVQTCALPIWAMGIAFEVDQVFVAAILTVIGYSLNDTVIIYDRVREYLGLGTSHDRKRIFNDAINSTLNRTRSEEHTSELQSRENLVCRLLLE